MKLKPLACVLALSMAGLAAAHDDATLDKTAAPNGGQLRMAGPYHYELVVVKDSKSARDNPVRVYVTDHAGNKVAAAGFKGTASILAPSGRATVALAPDGDNRLKGVGKYASDPGMKVVVTLSSAEGKSEQARFEPLARTSAASADHSKH